MRVRVNVAFTCSYRHPHSSPQEYHIDDDDFISKDDEQNFENVSSRRTLHGRLIFLIDDKREP